MKILKKYWVGVVKIKIVMDDDGTCKYIVDEPELTSKEEKIVNEVVSDLLYTTKQNIQDEIIKRVKKKGLKDESVEKVVYYIKKELMFGAITPLMLDPEVEEIECSGYGNEITVIHRSFSECIRLYTNIVLKSDKQVIRIIEKLAARANKSVQIARPYLEFALPEGHRVSATVHNEISIPGSTFDIRKFPSKPLSITAIIKRGMMNELVAAYLWFLLEYKPFIMILGPTGAGKTTLLNSLLSMVNPNYKILTIEDTPEINVKRKNWVRFISRVTFDKTLNVTLDDLARLSLRYRPDYLVIGEIRGREIEALIHASASGHASLTTFHGASPHDAVTRISDLLNIELSKLFLQTIWDFIIVGTRKEGNKNVRSVLSIYETHFESNETEFERVIEWDFSKKKFVPDDVQTLFSKSYKLKQVQELYGLSDDDVKNEIEKRANYLRKLLDENITDTSEVSNELKKFYAGGWHGEEEKPRIRR